MELSSEPEGNRTDKNQRKMQAGIDKINCTDIVPCVIIQHNSTLRLRFGDDAEQMKNVSV